EDAGKGAQTSLESGDAGRVETADAEDDAAGNDAVPAVLEDLLERGGPELIGIDLEGGLFGGEVDPGLVDAVDPARGLLDGFHAARAVHAADPDFDLHRHIVLTRRPRPPMSVVHRAAAQGD